VTRTRLVVAILAVSAAVAGLLIAVSLGSGGSMSKTTAAAATPASVFAGIPQHGTVLGRPSAPVTLHEYADLQCPYCAEWSRETLPSVVREYVRTGRLKLDFRGLAFIGPDKSAADADTIDTVRAIHAGELRASAGRRRAPPTG
jgi:protein-disulfide isomerase